MSKLPAGSRKEQDLSAYEDLTDEQLEKIMAGKMEDPVAQDDEPEPDPEPEVEEEEEEEAEEEPAEEDSDEDEEESQDDDADEGADEPEDSEPSLAKRMELLEKRLMLESLKRERAEEAQKRAELLASKNAGKAGYLQQQLQEKKKGKPAKPASGDAEDGGDDPWSAVEGDESNQEASPAPAENPLWAEDRKELVEFAINDEGAKFAAAHADELEDMNEDFHRRWHEIIAQESTPYRDAFRTSSIKAVRKLAQSIMATSYATARIEFADKVSAEAAPRKAESVANSRRRKKKAAITKSGQGKKQKARAKSYDDMTEEELEAEFKREFGENYNARRDTLL